MFFVENVYFVYGETMLQDLMAIAKYSVMFIGSLFGFLRLSRIKLRPINLLDLVVAVLLAAGLRYATKYVQVLVPTGYLLLTALYAFLRYRRSVTDAAIIGTIACGLGIVIMIVSLALSVPFDFLIYKYVADELAWSCSTAVVICAIQLAVTFLFYNIKRLKSGIAVSNNNGSIEILLLLGIASIFLMTLFYVYDIAKSFTEVIMIAIVFCGLALIVWWKKHITGNYQKQLFKRNEQLYEHRIEEYEKERSELLRQNEELSKIIHRDNKLIPAMMLAVKDVIATAPSAEATELLARLEELSSERENMIEVYSVGACALPKTDVIALNTVLHFIYSKAKQAGVELSVTVGDDCIGKLSESIPDMTDLSTVLCDLGENAVISAKAEPSGMVGIEFGLTGSGEPYFCFYDNGKPFDEKVLSDMGRKRVTTHKSDGGSGIGLMTLFEILRKYNASFCLDERRSESVYSKCIKIAFDGRRDVRIATERERVKRIAALRPDFSAER